MHAKTHGKKATRIVLAEDHVIVRAGLRALLGAVPDLDIVGEAGDGREAVRACEELNPDVVLLDLSMPRTSGMTALQQIKKLDPAIKVLVLTVHKTEEHLMAALKHGADGYTLKDCAAEELVAGIRAVRDGHRYLSPSLATRVIDGYLGGGTGGGNVSVYDALSPREREVLKLIAEGHRNREIADLLCISVKTVEKHRSNVMRKLELRNVQALTAYAIDKGLVTV